MTNDTTRTALVEQVPRQVERVQELAGTEITTPQEFAARIRALQGQAHILSPMAAVARIAPSHVINTMVVVIDPSVDPKSGRGAHVYHQRAIHAGTGRGENYQPKEVSLNKQGLLNILQGFGASVYPPTREFRDRYWWIVSHDADLLTFDGRYIRLPPGTASVDLRDGSADIGEWTPEAWKEAVRIADEQRKRTPPDDQWKIKPNVNNWSLDRVLQARKYGLEMAESRSLNRLIRNVAAIKQSYTIEELQKPFVIFRASYVPDTSDPEVRRQLTEAALGARHTLYPGAVVPQVPFHDGPVSHAAGDPVATIEGEVTHEPDQMTTAPLPADTEEFIDTPREPEVPQADVFYVLKVRQRGKGAEAQYFAETKEGVTLYTPDIAVARACKAASQDGRPREIPTERVQVGGQTYRQILEIAVVGGLKL